MFTSRKLPADQRPAVQDAEWHKAFTKALARSTQAENALRKICAEANARLGFDPAATRLWVTSLLEDYVFERNSRRNTFPSCWDKESIDHIERKIRETQKFIEVVGIREGQFPQEMIDEFPRTKMQLTMRMQAEELLPLLEHERRDRVALASLSNKRDYTSLLYLVTAVIIVTGKEHYREVAILLNVALNAAGKQEEWKPNSLNHAVSRFCEKWQERCWPIFFDLVDFLGLHDALQAQSADDEMDFTVVEPFREGAD